MHFRKYPIHVTSYACEKIVTITKQLRSSPSSNVHASPFLCSIPQLPDTLSVIQFRNMFKSAFRAAPRRILSSRTQLNSSSSRRFLITAPPSQKSRSWKSSAARWGLAAAGVYYYNTSNVFAEEPEGKAQFHIQD